MERTVRFWLRFAAQDSEMSVPAVRRAARVLAAGAGGWHVPQRRMGEPVCLAAHWSSTVNEVEQILM